MPWSLPGHQGWISYCQVWLSSMGSGVCRLKGKVRAGLGVPSLSPSQACGGGRVLAKLGAPHSGWQEPTWWSREGPVWDTSLTEISYFF